ncbi:MAG: PEP-CTERM sorting domain-containing protein [Phycisphaeraceae bacterium]
MKSLLTTTCLVAVVGMSSVASANMLNNPGFEDPLGFDFSVATNWNGFFGGPPGVTLAAFNDVLPASEANSGNQALFLRITGNTDNPTVPTTPGFDSFTGHVQQIPGISAGVEYVASIFAKEIVNSGNAVEFRIEWFDAGDGPLGSNQILLQDDLTSEYQQFEVSAVAPPTATRANVVLAVQSFVNDGVFANIQIAADDASFGIVPEPASAALLALGGLAAFRRR